jgi:hypothetical protein
MFDRQAPDIKVITDGNNNINLQKLDLNILSREQNWGRKTYHKASINSNRYPQHTKQVRNLVNIITQSARPSDANMLLKEWTKGVNDTVSQGKDEYVIVWERQLDKMCCDYLSN